MTGWGDTLPKHNCATRKTYKLQYFTIPARDGSVTGPEYMNREVLKLSSV